MTRFEQYIQEQKRKSVTNDSFNATERVEEFRNSINALYSSIDKVWLASFLASGDVKTGVAPISITESSLGTYQVDAKWIEIGPERFTLTPIGTCIVGANARIDMSHNNKEAMLVLVGTNVNGAMDSMSKGGKLVWKIVDSDVDGCAYHTIDKDSFQDLIIDLANEDN